MALPNDGDYGDVTVSGSGTQINIDPGVVTNNKLANVATATVKGRMSPGTGAPEDLPLSSIVPALDLNKADVGLDQVDNTSDANKPISALTQAALALKADAINPVFTGTVTGITKAHVGLSNVDNTADMAKPVSVAVATALAGKVDKANPVFTGTVTGITKAAVGLDQVDNTSDLNKPVSTSTQAALDTKQRVLTQGWGINLASDGTIAVDPSVVTGVPPGDKGPITVVDANTWHTNNGMTPFNALTNVGPKALLGRNEATTGALEELTVAQAKSLLAYTPSDLGLGNVDNTSDLLKPLSYASINALGLKANTNNPTFTGTVSGVTKAMVGLSNVDNTSDLNKPISNAVAAALASLAPRNNPTFTGTVSGISKAMVGLDQVDNTSDANKPLSNAMVTALAQKQKLLIQGAGITIASDGTISATTYSDGNKGDVTTASYGSSITINPGVVNNTKLSPVPTATFKGRVSAGTGTPEDLTVTQVRGLLSISNVDNTSDLNKPVSNATAAAIATAIAGVGGDVSGKENAIAPGTTAQYWRGDKTWQTLNKAAVGLDQVDNTSDANKPISTAVATALAGKEPTLAAGSFTQFYRGDKTWQTLNKAAVGLSNVDNTADVDKPVSTATATALANKEPTITAGTTGQYWRGDKTWQTLSKATIGLSNVDNTSDLNKPVSTATSAAISTAIATREPTIAPGLTTQFWRGDKTWAVIDLTGLNLNNVDNTHDLDKPISTATQAALNTKEPTIAAGTALQYWRGDKTWQTVGTVAVGLSNVDNTSDLLKPISTATQTALNAKEPTITAGTTSQFYRGDKTWVAIDKSTVGLSNVDNTSDANKPLSTAATTALAGKEATIAAGTASQYWRGDKTWQTLDKSTVGLANVDNTSDANKPISTAVATALAGKEPTVAAGTNTQFYRGDKTWVAIDKSTVGLANVDNTSDANKPISTATATALAGKEATITAGTTLQYWRGDKTWQTLNKAVIGLDQVDNTSDANKPISTAVATALAAKAPTNSPTFTGDVSFAGTTSVSGLSAGLIGLDQVDNTSDANKPVSVATQEALDLKVNSSLVTTKGSLVTGDGTAPVELVAGADYSILAADSTSGKGVAWFTLATLPGAAQVIRDVAAASLTTGTSTGISFSYDGTHVTAALTGTTGLADGDYGGIVVSGGGTVISIGAQAVGNLQLALMDSGFIKGRVSAGNGDVEDIALSTLGSYLTLTKADVGLDLADNTADLDKPISTATQTALDTKEPTIAVGTTSQYWRGDKTWQPLDKATIGLDQVDNTSDADKPLSTATVVALAGKEPTVAAGTTTQFYRGDKTWVGLQDTDVAVTSEPSLGASLSDAFTSYVNYQQSLVAAQAFGYDPVATTGLDWAYHGGYWNGTLVPGGVVTLTSSVVNYVVISFADGSLSAATDTTNWNDSLRYRRIAEVLAQVTSVDTSTDARGGPGGLFFHGQHPFDLPVICGLATTAVSTGTSVGYAVATRAALLSSVLATVLTPSRSGDVQLDVKVNGTSIFTTAVTIDATETSSATATTPYALTVSPTPLAVGDVVTVDVTSAGTGAAGLNVVLSGIS